jgi:hypothetical protein
MDALLEISGWLVKPNEDGGYIHRYPEKPGYFCIHLLKHHAIDISIKEEQIKDMPPEDITAYVIRVVHQVLAQEAGRSL